LLHLQGVPGDLLEALGNGVAVNGSESSHLEDQQVESALGKVGFGRVHGVRPLTSTYITIRVEAQGIPGQIFWDDFGMLC